MRASDVPTALTLAVTGAWLASLIIRLYRPEWNAASGLDALMLLIVGYWFSVNSIRKNGNGNGHG